MSSAMKRRLRSIAHITGTTDIHDLYRLLGNDTAMLVSTLKRLLAEWPSSAARAADLVNAP